MLSKEKIATFANLLYMIIEEYSVGFDETTNRMLRVYMSRIKTDHHVNGLAKFFNYQLLPDDCNLISQYTISGTNHTKVFDTIGEWNDDTTFHVSIVTDDMNRNNKDNYYVMSKDQKNFFVAIPKRMVYITSSNREAINYYMKLLYTICEGYWSRNLVPYIFCKKIFTVDHLASMLYKQDECSDHDIESYIDSQIPELYTEPLTNIIQKQLDLLQEGDENIWRYLDQYDSNGTAYVGKEPYYYWKEYEDHTGGEWIKY